MIAGEKIKAANICEGLSDWVLSFEREPKDGGWRQFFGTRFLRLGMGY
jgi:hypothetical protein